ncbi:BatD family protein [Caldichromatium japonicum]|uniref:BatD family protein n=1 Tax=Caldichromatium japonicum TaxID=2699430 RepID=UPI001FE80815|nr:BatD family protein [Caldichromatium japonicum]
MSVQVDRQRLARDEVLELILSAEGEVRAEPDFGPLKQDFELLGQTQSEVTKIINGRISHRNQWRLRLAPKRAGHLTIPPIQVGREQGPSIAIEVTERTLKGLPSIQTQGEPAPLFVTAEVETTQPYVQQPIEYRARVYYRQPPQRATLSEPEAEGALIQRLGEDRAYDETYRGQGYRVIERRYRMIPQRSGELRIRSPRLEAVVADPNQTALPDLDRLFGQLVPDLSALAPPGRRVVERAEDLVLAVRPRPLGATGHWLPATSVQLNEEWTPQPSSLRLGEPITRTLTLTAEGTTAAQLPDLELGAIPGLQVYPDRPQAEDLAQGSRPAAVKTFRFALVPTQPGTLTLPEIRVPWWDTQDDRARAVVIPARTLQVVGPSPTSGQSAGVQTGGKAGQQAEDRAQAQYADAQSRDTETHPARQSALGGIWPWVSLLLGLGWLATLWVWQRERRKSRGPQVASSHGPQGASSQTNQAGGALRTPQSATAEQEARKARSAIHTACLANDPRATRAALLAWGRLHWPDAPPVGLDALAERLGNPELRPLLRAIDGAIYAPPGQEWEGSSAWERLAPYLGMPAEQDHEPDSPLPRLYPESGR